MDISTFLKDHFLVIMQEETNKDLDYLQIEKGLPEFSDKEKAFMKQIQERIINKEPMDHVRYTEIYDRVFEKDKEKKSTINNIIEEEEQKMDFQPPNPIKEKWENHQKMDLEPKNPIIIINKQAPLPLEILIKQGLLCTIEYREIDKNELPPSLFESFLNTFTNRTLHLPDENSRIFNLVQEINVRDELGEWKYEPLQGCLSMHLTQTNKQCFPSSFRIPKEYFSFEKNTMEMVVMNPKPKMADKQEHLTLKNFLKMVLDVNNKDPSNLISWLDKFKAQFIERVDELVDWEESDWEKCNLEPNIKRLIRKELAKFKFKTYSNLNKKLSNAERISVIHRIKRFFHHTIGDNELQNLEFLNSKAVKSGFQEIRNDYVGEYLLKQLECFYYTFSIPKSYSKNLQFSRGMLLYGPPGTGKTTLTDKLPSIIGLTPISYPLCAAEVNRSLVGQTEKLLIELFARATKVPYLLCSISIDEIDGLAPKRDEKSSQHKGDVLGVLLSLIGGIKDVDNLVILASTNRLNMMDEAFRRRMSGQFFMGRPSPDARRIMIKKAEKTYLEAEMIEQAVMITSNFSGAALKQFISDVICETHMKDHPLFYEEMGLLDEKNMLDRSLLYEEIAEIAKRNSYRFNIKMGNYSLPELFSLHRSNESIINMKFLQSIEGRIGLISFEREMVFVSYVRSRKQFLDNDKPKVKELVKKLVFLDQSCKDFFSLVHYFSFKLKNNDQITAEYFTLIEDDNQNIRSYLKVKMTKIMTKAKQNPNTLFLVFWDDMFDGKKNLEIAKDKFQMLKEAIHECLDMTRDNITHLINSHSEETFTTIKNLLNWSKYDEFRKESLKFTGRIMVDLSDEVQEVRYELEGKNGEYRLYCEPLFLEKRALNSQVIVPALAEFASKRGIDFILLMDQDFLLSNNAFDETKVK